MHITIKSSFKFQSEQSTKYEELKKDYNERKKETARILSEMYKSTMKIDEMQEQILLSERSHEETLSRYRQLDEKQRTMIKDLVSKEAENVALRREYEKQLRDLQSQSKEVLVNDITTVEKVPFIEILFVSFAI